MPYRLPLLASLLAVLACVGPAFEPAPEGTGSSPPRVTPSAPETTAPAPVASGLGVVPAAAPLAVPLSSAPLELEFSVQLQNADFAVLAVDAKGKAYAVRYDNSRLLWASTDSARSWSKVGTLSSGSLFQMAVLGDGTLLADVVESGIHHLARSEDGGAHWSRVLELGKSRLLTPRSVAELSGKVYLGEYQTERLPPTPIRVWESTDGGRSFQVLHTFTAYRHLHGLIADPATHSLWALTGDPTGELLRSRDGARSWQVVVPGALGVAVDAVVTPKGLLYATDALSRPAVPAVVLVHGDDHWEQLQQLRGPSYSIQALPQGGFLATSARESGGNVYPSGDESAWVYGSVDGRAWKELLSFPRLSATRTAHANVYWRLASGEVLVDVRNVQGFGADGHGYLVARARLR